MHELNHDVAAQRLEALGSPLRLAIYRLLVQAGPDGLAVGDIQAQLAIPASTLSHHVARLVANGLVAQVRQQRRLICCCNYDSVNRLIDYLMENCCGGECQPDTGS